MRRIKILTILLLFSVTILMGCAGCPAGCPGGGGTPATTSKLSIVKFRFASGDGDKPETLCTTFKPNKKIWILFDVVGLEQKPNNEVWIQEDLKVTDPTGRAVLVKPNIVDFHNRLKKKIDRLPINNTIKLPEKEVRGIYKVLINIRDNLQLAATSKTATFTLE